MFPMNKPVSILSVFRHKLWFLSLFTGLLIGITLSLISFYILEAIIQKTAQHELQIYQSALNNDDTFLMLQKMQNQTQLPVFLPQQSLHQIQILSSTGEQIYSNNKNLSTPLFEQIIDVLFFKKPLVDYYKNNHTSGTIEVKIKSHSFLPYYALLFSGIGLILLTLPFLIWSYIFITHRRLYQNIQPIIQTLHDFNPQAIYYKRAPYSYIQEIQIFNDCYHILLDKLENTRQNLVEQNTILNFQATHDALTTLPNRQYFQQVLERDFNLNLNSFMVVLFIDSNKFKDINDTYGHQAGDAVLIETAKRLRKSIRNEDFVARLGGDEFAAILKRVEKHEDLVKICEKLIRCCDEPLIFDGTPIPFSFSVGASYAYHATNIKDFLHLADLAMYQAKKSEKKWHIYKRESAFSYIEDDEDTNPS